MEAIATASAAAKWAGLPRQAASALLLLLLLHGAAVVDGDGEAGFRKAETLTDHTRSVYSVAWSHNSSHLATAGGFSDATLIAYETETWSIVKTLVTKANAVNSVAWSHDSSLLASGSTGYAPNPYERWNVYYVDVYETKTWSIVKQFKDHDNEVESLAWSHDSSQLATVGGAKSGSGSMYVYETQTWSIVKRLWDHADTIWSVAWSHDSSQLATCSSDKSVIVYYTKTWNIVKTLTGHKSGITSVAWSHDSSQLATGSGDGSVIVYETKTWNIVQTLKDHTDTGPPFWNAGSVRTVEWSHDSSQLATGSADKSLIVYETKTWNIVQTLKEHTGGVTSVAWAHDSSQLATGSSDDSVVVYDNLAIATATTTTSTVATTTTTTSTVATTTTTTTTSTISSTTTTTSLTLTSTTFASTTAATTVTDTATSTTTAATTTPPTSQLGTEPTTTTETTTPNTATGATLQSDDPASVLLKPIKRNPPRLYVDGSPEDKQAVADGLNAVLSDGAKSVNSSFALIVITGLLRVDGTEEDCKAVAAGLNGVSHETKSVTMIACYDYDWMGGGDWALQTDSDEDVGVLNAVLNERANSELARVTDSTSTSKNNNSTVNASSTASTSSRSAGKIVGGILGGLVLLCALLALAYYYYYYYRAQGANGAKERGTVANPAYELGMRAPTTVVQGDLPQEPVSNTVTQTPPGGSLMQADNSQC